MKKIVCIGIFIFYIGVSLTMAANATVKPGYIEKKSLPAMHTVIAASKDITGGKNEFVIFYYRTDARYDKWNLWLWNNKINGSRHSFTGVVNGVAYYKNNKDIFFDETTRDLNFIVRTDQWEKDPGTDQQYCIESGDRFAVFSGDPGVYPVGPVTPKIIGVTLTETTPGEFCLTIRLSVTFGLTTKPGPNGFSLSGGLTVTDAYPFSSSLHPANRDKNLTDRIVVRFTGTVTADRDYYIEHPQFGRSGIFRFPSPPAPAPYLSRGIKQLLPEPVLADHPDWIDLYWAAWRFMHEKITGGNEDKGFVPLYIDEGFNENIYQWDSCFMAAYAIYGPKVFPAMATLDNFYNHQRMSDGYICRCYNENTGLMTGENDINPTLFAWIEWRYYRVSGNTQRINRVLKHLDLYFSWCKKNARSVHSNDLYYITDLGSGMDNSPREHFVKHGAWIDISSQQALAALCIARLAEVSGNIMLWDKYTNEFNELKNLINGYLWNDEYKMYYDRTEDGAWHIRNTIASFWPMVAEITDDRQAGFLLTLHLRNPDEFYRPHLFPTLAANDPVYNPSGHYWRGGVWAPTTYAAIKGIEKYDRTFAREAAVNHIENMSIVYHQFNPDSYQYKLPGLTEPNIPRNGDGRHQIWEAYSPEEPAPATRWDAELLVRQKFCGWSGLGPVALLIENVLGFSLNAPQNTVTWRINTLETHGLRRFQMGDNTISLTADRRSNRQQELNIQYKADKDFNLIIYDFDAQKPVINTLVKAGSGQLP